MSVEQEIRLIIKNVVNGFDAEGLKPDSPFLEAGMDSLDMATVLLEVQEKYDVVVQDGEEDNYDTLAKLTAFVEQNRAAG